MLKKIRPTSWSECKRKLATVGTLHDEEWCAVGRESEGAEYTTDGREVDIGGPIRPYLMNGSAKLLEAARRIIKNDHRDFTPTEALRMLFAAETLIQIAQERRERGHRIAKNGAA